MTPPEVPKKSYFADVKTRLIPHAETGFDPASRTTIASKFRINNLLDGLDGIVSGSCSSPFRSNSLNGVFFKNSRGLRPDLLFVRLYGDIFISIYIAISIFSKN